MPLQVGESYSFAVTDSHRFDRASGERRDGAGAYR